MKYFTIDWYKEMQVSGFLVFPETKEEWNESIEFYKAEGIAYKKNHKEDLESRKNDLLKFLPETFHPYIFDGTLGMDYPSPELRKMAEEWQSSYENRMEDLFKVYNNYYQSIKNKLPKNVVTLHDNSLHDAQVTSFHRPSKETFEMTMDCRGGFHYFTDVKLTFLGVQELSEPDFLEEAYWLYDEIHSTEKGFELNVLFDCPLKEFTIKAENVLIEEIK
ncbi:DUF4085 family protein [Bacillus gobiensis]|uniref:DUF4085 family protein n=1 Tax=Bacillus gobiensis TaxID=1441095 RepID=UPI003D1D6436